MPDEQYVHTEILSKLHMDGSTFRFADVPAARRAIGYRLKPDGTYAEEPPLPHGVFGSMGEVSAILHGSQGAPQIMQARPLLSWPFGHSQRIVIVPVVLCAPRRNLSSSYPT